MKEEEIIADNPSDILPVLAAIGYVDATVKNGVVYCEDVRISMIKVLYHLRRLC